MIEIMSLHIELLEPIAGDRPGGSNIRYEPIYDKIKLARTEEVDAPQGEWTRARKTADHALVVKLAREVLAKQSKDLQIAAWLTEALTYREGFPGLAAGLELLRALLDQFWEHLYPEFEDGDAELRAAPLEWVGSYLADAVRSVPLNAAGHGLNAYRESRAVGYEVKEYDPAREAARAEAIAEGKLTAEEFDEGFAAASKDWYRALNADLDRALESLDALDLLSQERFGEDAPAYYRLRDLLHEVRRAAGQLLARKLEADPDPVAAGEAAGGGGTVGDGGEGEAVPSGQAAGSSGVAVPVVGGVLPTAVESGGELLERARELVRGGESRAAIELLVMAALQEPSPRARFLRRVQAAGIMVDTGLERVALPILRELVAQLEEFRLEEWEAGEVVAQPLGFLYRCLERTGEDPELREQLYLRICRLDPLQAIRLAGGSAGGSHG